MLRYGAMPSDVSNTWTAKYLLGSAFWKMHVPPPPRAVAIG